MMGLNANAAEIVEEMKDRAEELRIEVLELENRATVLDCGVKAPGCTEAGRLFSLVSMGGLAKVTVSSESYGGLRLPVVKVDTGEPYLACMASQKAAWKVKTDRFFALGSGPARVLAEKGKGGYTEDSDVAVLALESAALPDEKVARHVAERCGVRPENLTLLAARTASETGSTQVSARMVETALFKMERLGMEAEVVHGAGTAPIAPVTGDDIHMMGVENDMIIYGSQVSLRVKGDVDVEAIPSGSSSDYGAPFLETFRRAGYDFYKIDPGIFAPAEIRVENILSGEVKTAGKIDPEMIKKALESR
ncbi:MAG: methenyltetrahydromethanopterin cyclohydrolase [Methanobacteriota archaeon]|nr:MAG: methenyltetrahydromethanopterin cyclohydrolase [Euryarchaeota archaeon]